MGWFNFLDAAIEAVRYRNKHRRRTDGNSITVTARVVSPPIPFNTRDAQLLYGDPSENRRREEARREQGSPSVASRVGAFAFRGYIVDKDWPQNPHLMVRNPCDMSTAVGTQIADIEDAIKLCTKFISEEGYSGPMPKVGDWVKVRLNKIRQPGKDSGSWNTADGDFISISDQDDITAADPAYSIFTDHCSSLTEAFRNNSSPGSAVTGPPGSSNLPTPPGAPPSGQGEVAITPDAPPIIQACEAAGYVMFHDGKVNLIGVRAQEVVSSDQFIDTMFISWKTGESWETRSYPITTTPGKYVLENPLWPKNAAPSGKRTAILKPGQYNEWQFWSHRGRYVSLGQVASGTGLTIYGDFTRDSTKHADQHASPQPESPGGSINIHKSVGSGVARSLTYNKKAGSTPPKGSWSEGCQVFQSADQYDEFMQVLFSKKDLMPRVEGWNNLTNGYQLPELSGPIVRGNYPTFTYTLLTYLDFDVASNTIPSGPGTFGRPKTVLDERIDAQEIMDVPVEAV